MLCLSCKAENEEAAESCFTCGKSLYGLTRGTIVGSRYVILTRLGRGAMGTVYWAHDRMLEENIALKVLRPDIAPDLARRFRSEIKLARRVSHKNVCRIHEYGEDGDLRFISMAYVEGVDLRHVLREKGPLPPDEAFEVAIQTAEGLQAIHDEGVVHRDLKTANIMRDERGVVKLMDFGIAKLMGQAGTSTATGDILGTPEYMSPEQARGGRTDARCDVYALGVVIFEMFSGDVPFRGDTPIATVLMHLQDPPPLEGPKAKRIPSALVAVLRKALAKGPGDRYGTAQEMAEALRRARRESFHEISDSADQKPVFHPSAFPARETPLPSPPGAPRMPAPRIEDLLNEVLPTPATAGATGNPPTVVRPEGRTRPWPWPWVAGLAALAAVGVMAGRRGGTGVTADEAPTRPAALTVATTLPPALPAETVAKGTDVTKPAGVATPSPKTVDPSTLVPTNPAPTIAPPTTSAAVAPAPTTPAPASLPPTTVARAASPPPVLASPKAARGTTEEAPRVPRTSPPPAAALLGEGMLQLRVRPWADVAVDGAPVGTTPMRPLTLSTGTHTIRLSHPKFEPLDRAVVIRTGETTRLEVDLGKEGSARP